VARGGELRRLPPWIPAFAGMSGVKGDAGADLTASHQPADDRRPAGGRPRGADARKRIRRERSKTDRPRSRFAKRTRRERRKLPYFTQLLFGAGFGARQTVAAEIAWMPTGL